MIVSHYVSEPVLSTSKYADAPPFHTGSELFTRLKARWRVIRRAVPLKALSTRLALGRPGPFQRLEFWTAHHPLLFKLRLYSVTEPKVNMWQGFTWETLRYWQDLMSGEEVERETVNA